MGRAEMRRQARLEGKKGKIYHLTQEQIENMKKETAKDAIDVCFALMLSIPSNVLARCYWEKTASKRIPQFIDECLSVYESIDAGVLSVTELIEDTEKLAKIKMNCVERIRKTGGKSYERNVY